MKKFLVLFVVGFLSFFSPVLSAKAPEYTPELSVRLNSNEIKISSSKSGYIQTVKRVEDKDAVCWVVNNNSDWQTSISCLPKSILNEEDPANPIQKHSFTGRN